MHIRSARQTLIRLAATSAMALTASLTAAATSAGPAQAAQPEGPEEGTYTVINARTDKCLQPLEGNWRRWSPIVQYECEDEDYENWELTYTEDDNDGMDMYTLRNEYSSKCLAVAGGVWGDFALVVQENCNEYNEAQQWYMYPAGGDRYYMRNARSNKCLRVPYGLYGDDVPVVQHGCYGGDLRRWMLEESD